MKLQEEIRMIDNISEEKLIVNKSIFISQVYPFYSENDLKEYLTIVRKKYYNASHHCYAFKLADDSVRYSDAGEPNGTAGLRILNAIEHFNLRNQLIIVSRIFGGIKLGIGSLGKAYYQSAYQIISDSKISIKKSFQKATISTTFDQISSVHRILSNHKSEVINSLYGELVELNCLINSTEIEIILKKFSDFSKNKIRITIHNEKVYK